MNRGDSRLLWAVVLAALALALTAVMAATHTTATGFSVLVYLTTNLIVFTDFVDFILRLYFCRINGGSDAENARGKTDPTHHERDYPYPRRHQCLHPYALVVSVHNLGERLDSFIEAMEPLRDRVWVIDDASTDDTPTRLRQDGWRCIAESCNRKKPKAVSQLIEALPADIETVMVIDPDIIIRDSQTFGCSDLEAVIIDFQHSGKAALCPRIAIKEGGLLARLQCVEYAMSFVLGRNSLADESVTSGIAIYRRDALIAIYERHSMSVYGEDFENSVLLLGMGKEIYYDGRLVVETDGVGDWRHWFSQRVGWSFGFIKVYVENFAVVRSFSRRSLIVTYQYLVYLGLFGLLAQPLKIVTVALLATSFFCGIANLFGFAPFADWTIADPMYFAGVYVKYLALMMLVLWLVVPREERRYVLPVIPLYFFYALAQVVPVTIGYLNWLSLKAGGRRLFDDHYQDQPSLGVAGAHQSNWRRQIGQA